MGRRDDIYERLMANTELLVDNGLSKPCRIWKGHSSGKAGRGRNGRGHSYPRGSVNGETVAVHRVIATHAYGYIPPRMTVDHICKNRMCIEEEHLEVVTHKENCRRRDRSRKKKEN